MTFRRLLPPLVIFAAVAILIIGLGRLAFAAGVADGRAEDAAIDGGHPYRPMYQLTPAPEPTLLAMVDLATGTPDSTLPGAPPVVVLPPVIHDPVSEPGEAFDQVKAARKIGWPVAVMVGTTMLLLALGHLGVTWLKTGARAFVLAAATTTITAAAVAGLDGGSWMAIVSAAAAAMLGYWNANRGPHPEPAPAAAKGPF